MWKRTFADVELTGDWSEDLLAIAESQLGYRESTENYIVDADGETIQGYTRYGAWYGNTYGEWCAMYVSFCLNYAEVENIPFEAGCQNWINKLKSDKYDLYREAGEYTPSRGDLIFFNLDSAPDSDHVAIVVEYTPATETESAKIKTIEGNSYYQVRYDSYDANASIIMGYGQLPEEPKEEATEELTKEFTITAKIYENDAYEKEADDDTVITITGLLPEGAEAKAYPVKLELEEQDVIYAYDITIFKEDGSVFEPAEEAPLTVNITAPELMKETGDVTPGMYYIPEDGEPESINSTIEDGNVSFTAEHFSVYALLAPRAASAVSNQTQLGAAITNGESYIQLATDFEVNNSSALVIPAGTSITLDLNGHVLTQKGSAALFDIKDGATLTIVDGQAPEETVEQAGGNLYANTAHVTTDSEGYATLTYYVTTSAVTNAATGATAETLYKHTVTTKGAIVANDQTVFNVGSGTLNIESGMVRSGSARAIYQTGGTVNITGGYICGFNQPYDDSYYPYGEALKYSISDFGGAVHLNGGTLNLSGNGVLAANTAACGGAVYVGNGANFNIAGGYISGNQALYHAANWKGQNDAACVGGGGIVANGTITMSGGYITNNVAAGGQYFDGGGGILLKNGASMSMSAGYITGNQAQAGGGLKTSFEGIAIFTMTGGHVSSNVTTAAEGGGIAIDRKGTATIAGSQTSKIYITNNIIPNTIHWGGGGLFGADGSTIYLTNVLITANEAGGFGGGVAGCPTGHLYLYVKRGCAIYDNIDVIELDGTKDGEPNFVKGGAKDEIDTQRCDEVFQANGHADYFCALESTVVNDILGGKYANWEGSADGSPIKAEKDESDILTASSVMGLTAHPSDAGKLAAQNEATTYINGNYSYTHGGGIMCNGNLVIGEPENVIIPVHLELQGVKTFTNANGDSLSLENNNFAFSVTNENGTEVAEGSCDENGKITFDSQIVIYEAGTYKYYIQEKVPENADSTIQYDSTKYTLYVTVEEGENKALYGDTWKKTYIVTNLRVTKQNGDGEEQEIAVNTETQDGVIVVLPDDEEQITFANINTDIVSMKVIKKWVGKTNDVDSVTVKLFRNEDEIETKVLNKDNNWQYTWTELPTKDDDGNTYTYQIEEVHVDGYVTTYETSNEMVIQTTTITNTNIDDAKFKLDLTKVSKEEPDITLVGAEFEVYDSNGNIVSFTGTNGAYTYAEAGVEGATTTVITVKKGKMYLDELPAGTYTLKEIKAPEGYKLMQDVKVELNEYSEPTIVLTLEDPEAKYVIPETGGIGTKVYMMGGILLMTASLLYGYMLRRKRERRIN